MRHVLVLGTAAPERPLDALELLCLQLEAETPRGVVSVVPLPRRGELLLQLGDEAAGGAATARATDPAAAPRVAAASQAAPAITLAGSADRTAARSAAGLARGPQKRAIAQAAAAPKPAKKRPKQQPQQARATTAAAAAAGDDSVLDHALWEAHAAQFRIEVGASRWSLWNQVTGKRVGKIETQVGKIKISCTLRGSQWTESATTKPEATELMRRLTTAAT